MAQATARDRLTFCKANPPTAISKYRAPGSTIPSPQSQSLSRGYGSILPTSLIYIVLSTRGYSPWRPDAVMSTTRGENNPRHRGFKGPRERIGYREKMRYFSSHPTLSPRNAIPGSAMVPCGNHSVERLSKKDENLPRDSRGRTRFRLRYRSVIHVLVLEC